MKLHAKAEATFFESRWQLLQKILLLHKSSFIFALIVACTVALTAFITKKSILSPATDSIFRPSVKISLSSQYHPTKESYSFLGRNIDDETFKAKNYSFKYQPEEALKTFLLFDPKNAAIIKTLAKIAFSANRFQEANNYFAQYIWLKPHKKEGYLYLAQSLFCLEKIASVEIVLENALKKVAKQDAGMLYLMLACAKKKIGDEDSAKENLILSYSILGDRMQTIREGFPWNPLVKEELQHLIDAYFAY